MSRLCTGEVALWHWWVSDCLLLCVYSRLCLSEVICISWVSAADWEYKQHAAVVVSVEWSTVNRSCAVLSVTNCDLHNWTATMCAKSCIEYIKQAVKLVMWQKCSKDSLPDMIAGCHGSEWKVVQMIKFQSEQLSFWRSFAGRHAGFLALTQFQSEDIKIWHIFIFQT